MTSLRLAWICGVVSSREYASRTRLHRYGAEAGEVTESALEKIERALLHERLAVIIVLVALVILTYTVLTAPALSA